jgi:hypothetical protein
MYTTDDLHLYLEFKGYFGSQKGDRVKRKLSKNIFLEDREFVLVTEFRSYFSEKIFNKFDNNDFKDIENGNFFQLTKRHYAVTDRVSTVFEKLLQYS